MEFERANLETCSSVQGVVVVIDVLRAFSTAAYAFGQGAEKITLVSTVEEAFLLKNQFPASRLMGEMDALSISGFDYNNSPTLIARQDLRGCHLIQRSSAGTQGVTRSVHADLLLASSFCCAGATARLITSAPPMKVTFVITGKGNGKWGDEDEACADYLECLLKGEKPEPREFLRRVKDSLVARKFMIEKHLDFPGSDIEHCIKLDKFDFAMQIKRQGGLFIMQPICI